MKTVAGSGARGRGRREVQGCSPGCCCSDACWSRGRLWTNSAGGLKLKRHQEETGKRKREVRRDGDRKKEFQKAQVNRTPSLLLVPWVNVLNGA